jgi:uncharacterized membrane protein YbhN (UPF0104 family)
MNVPHVETAARPYRTAWVGLKLAVSVGLMAWVLNSLDMATLVQAMDRLTPGSVVAACALIGLQQLILAWRWHRILHRMGHRWSAGQSLRWVYLGSLFNQALPSSIGGDAIRIWAVHQHGSGLGIAIGSVAVDRLTGLAVLAGMVSLAALLLSPALPTSSLSIALLAAGPLAIGGLALMLALQCAAPRILPMGAAENLARVTGAVRVSLGRPRAAVEVLGLGALASLLALMASAALGQSLGVEASMLTYVALVGGATLFSVLPVSLGGWGVRETSMVALFSLVGSSKEAVLAMSVSSGLLALVVVLPAALLWWLRPASHKSEGDSGEPI